jgi:hypothetical protein
MPLQTSHLQLHTLHIVGFVIVAAIKRHVVFLGIMPF